MRPLLAALALLTLSGCPFLTPAAGDTLCGTGTTLQGNTCVASSAGATCGAGTVLSGTECVPAGASITCGEGTTLQSGRCVASGGGAGFTCGTGTVASGSTCVVDTTNRRGYRDYCQYNADCGCYASKADDPTCAAAGTKKLICKGSTCTLDCTVSTDCTSVFPAGAICNSSHYCY